MTNAEVVANYAEELGISNTSIIKEGKFLNTYENLINSWRIIEKMGFERPVLVCFDVHTRRVLTTVKKLGLKEFYWLSVYSKGEPGYGPKWLQTFSRLTIFVYEILALIYSKLVGWVAFKIAS